jgi:lysyl-tRNA synthetase class 2
VLWINRLDADRPLSVGFVLHELGAGVLGIHATGSPQLHGAFGDWFPLSLLLLSVAATAWVLAGWLAPWRYRQAQEARERDRARALVHAWGADTLAPFALRGDKSYFFADDDGAFVAYRVVGHVAIVSGDPVGPPAALDALLDRFIEFAHDRDWRVAVLGVSEERLDLYRRHGLLALYHGDEAVVDTAAFSLEGRAIRKVRQSVHRLEQAGYSAAVLSAAEADDALRRELDDVAGEWRGAQPERGFVMALPSLWQGESVLVVGRDADGRAVGCLQFAPSPAGSALSLSSMPRRRSTPNGFNEWLICTAIGWAREAGYARVSLNFAPFAALLAPEAQLTARQELQRRALCALKGRFQLDSLLLFNRKFLPDWQRRFVVVERRLDLPRVGIAALAVEAYLPFQSARR